VTVDIYVTKKCLEKKAELFVHRTMMKKSVAVSQKYLQYW